ncbi:PIN domain-containing protein [Candidatus Micrarchaeota archaeon]|nr:PIN domain-containing protein [Candidatus Micrarchaeota archaeon]
MYELAMGNPNYTPWMRAEAATSRLQLMELYYRLLATYGEQTAEKYRAAFSKYIVDFDDFLMKNAMRFRLEHKEKRLSYVDCIGYFLAASIGAQFLTGDSAFKGMPNVEFAK